VIPNHNRLTSCNTCTRSAEDVGGQGKPALRVLARWAGIAALLALTVSVYAIGLNDTASALAQMKPKTVCRVRSPISSNKMLNSVATVLISPNWMQREMNCWHFSVQMIFRLPFCNVICA